MKTPIQILDPADTWAQVELYRWQHGRLPGESGKKEQPLSVPAGLRAMAAAIETRDPSKYPDPFNVMMVLKFAAAELERAKKQNNGSLPPEGSGRADGF